jgi:DUF2946 family protein
MTALSQPRTRHRLALLVLPALLLRALIPVGFMPVAAPGGAALRLCPGAVGQGMVHAGHGAHDAPHTQHHGGADPGSTHHTPCLFSAGASTGFAALLAAPALEAAAPGAPAERLAARPFVPAILRAQGPRAPPRAAPS